MLKSYGIAPTGPDGTYRARDYVRGSLTAALVAVALFFALLGVAALLGASSIIVLWISAILGLGALVATAAALILLAYAALGLRDPPAFADPRIPVREVEDDENDTEHPLG